LNFEQIMDLRFDRNAWDAVGVADNVQHLKFKLAGESTTGNGLTNGMRGSESIIWLPIAISDQL
jgi:hypothetical protein